MTALTVRIEEWRYLAKVAIRDGEAWRDRRLPEMGRALNDAVDVLEAAEVTAFSSVAPDETRRLAAILLVVAEKAEATA